MHPGFAHQVRSVFWVFGISRCSDQTRRLFDFFEIGFFGKPQSDTEGAKDENNNSLCSLWFNLP